MVRALTGHDRPLSSPAAPGPFPHSLATQAPSSQLFSSRPVSSASSGSAEPPSNAITTTGSRSSCAVGAAAVSTTCGAAERPASQEHATQLPTRCQSDESEQTTGLQSGRASWFKEGSTESYGNGSRVSSMEISEVGSRSCSQPFSTTTTNGNDHAESLLLNLASISTEGSNTSGICINNLTCLFIAVGNFHIIPYQ